MTERQTSVTTRVLVIVALVLGACGVTALRAPGSAASAAPLARSPEPAALLRWTGEGSSATGAALSSGECDVNGDGFDDVVVGAWFWDKAPTSNVGAAYVLLGGPQVAGGNLANPAAAGAVRIDGPNVASAFVGFAVGCLGDVNGDGIDDIGISYYVQQRAYVVFGAKPFTAVNLDALGTRGFTVHGTVGVSGNVGYALGGVGDVTGDGLDDFAVAEVAADTQGRTNNGRVWVVAGQDDIADVDLGAPSPGQIPMTIDGASSEERLGAVSAVGDVNGDGTADLLLGSYTATPWGGSVAVPGAAYVVFGGTSGEVDAADLGEDGFAIYGPTRQRDRLGVSVSAAGDVNGDGLADLLIGADGVTNAATGNRSGGAAVVYGSASTATVYTDPAASNGASVYTCAASTTPPACDGEPATRGWWIDGAVTNDSTGYSVAGIGDVNGDGIPDLVIGAYGYDPVNPASPPATMSGAGAVWVVYGKADPATVSLASLDADAGYRIDGVAAGDRFGRQVAAVGDIDANGVADLAIGADFAARPLAPATPISQAGEVTVALLGQLVTTTSVSPSTSTATDGDTVTFTVQVGVEVGGGTVDVERGGVVLDGCDDVPVDASAGTASCQATLRGAGAASITARFSGTPSRAESVSTPATVDVAATTTTAPPTTGPGGGLPAGASAYAPVAPCRLADTRDGTGVTDLGGGAVRVQVAGRCDVPADATAAALTLTVDHASTAGFVTAWPTGGDRPTVSNLNFGRGETRANGAIVKLGTDGAIDVFSMVPVHGLIVDVTGAFAAAGEPTSAGRYQPLTPTRLLDTRETGGKVPAGGNVTVPLPADVPADASAVSVNVTATESNGAGYVTVWPAGTTRPTTSTLNTDARGQTRAAGAIVPVSAGGLQLYSMSGTHLVVDVTGWYTGASTAAGDGGLLVPVAPTRLLDTRATGQRLRPGTTVDVATREAASIAANVTIVDVGAPGWIAAYATGTVWSGTSTVNASSTRDIAASLAVVPLAGSGITVYAQTAADVVVDEAGWFTATGSSGGAPTGPGTTAPVTTPPATTPPTSAPTGAQQLLSEAYVNRNWTPTAYDTCPASLHQQYSAVGPDGKLYPTWHPSQVVDPATGQLCTFGHEHGDDPSTSDIYDWVVGLFAPPGGTDRPGIPFGFANEALDTWSNGGTTTAERHEDNVGNKIIVANDVRLVASDPRGFVRFTDASGNRVPIECDYLIKIHQGSHSADATTNNAHELFYAVRCNDGTELAITTLSRFGDANEYNRSCAPSTVVTTSGSDLPDGAGGSRQIPDRTCIDQYVLVSPTTSGAHSDIWSLYEVWKSMNSITTASGRTLASFDPWFAVRNPSRYGWSAKNPDGSDGIGATVAAAWETDPADDGTVNADPWLAICTLPEIPKESPASPFDGSQRDFYLAASTVENAGGATVWYTDPYGGNARTTPFPGSVRQWISATSNTWYPALERQNLGVDDDYGSTNGVHAPN